MQDVSMPNRYFTIIYLTNNDTMNAMLSDLPSQLPPTTDLAKAGEKNEPSQGTSGDAKLRDTNNKIKPICKFFISNVQ